MLTPNFDKVIRKSAPTFQNIIQEISGPNIPYLGLISPTWADASLGGLHAVDPDNRVCKGGWALLHRRLTVVGNPDGGLHAAPAAVLAHPAHKEVKARAGGGLQRHPRQG